MDERKLHVPARSVFAAILLSVVGSPTEGQSDWPTIVDLSNKILDLRKNIDLDTSHISIRADRNGWISDDFSSFVDRFVLFGLAESDPVRLSDQARRLCEKILAEDLKKHAEQVGTLVHALRLDLPAAKENLASPV
jgi:hypothetical protein